jgi:RNA-directed DNA polymerase
LTVHRKSWQIYKDKVRAITARSRSMSMEARLMELRLLNLGWGNYFKISDSRSPFKEADKWVRSRLRLCLWKQWKQPKTKIKELTKLGTTSYQAYQWGNTRKGYWRVVHSPILTRSLDNKRLKEMGFLSLIDVVTPFSTVNT